MAAHWPAPAGLHATSARLPVEGRLPSFEGATGWLNSPPLTAAGLQGKIVLVKRDVYIDYPDYWLTDRLAPLGIAGDGT